VDKHKVAEATERATPSFGYCTSLQADNHASTPPLSFFYRPDALPVAQTTASKH